MAQTSDFAYEKVCSMIYDGRLQPGERLVESNLAGRLGISHIPLRESLVRLESEGLVRRVPNWATFVENVEPADTLELYAMRLALEPVAARLAANRSGPRLIKQLQRLYDQMTDYQKQEDIRKLDQADYRFHLAIVQASQFKRLIRAYESCHIQVLSYHTEGTRHLRAVGAYSREHELIIESIAAHRPEAAERAAQRHVSKAMRRLEKVLGMRFEDPAKPRP